MGKAIDLTGKRFERWTVIKRVEDRKDKRGYPIRYWLCKCDCGILKEVSGSSLMKGQSKSCGCLQKEKVSIASKNKAKPFKYEIGQIVETNNGSITILDRTKIRKTKSQNGKFYLYKCNNCGYESDIKHAISEYTLSNGHGCSVCGGGSAVQYGVNDISTIAPWMVPYFKDINDAYTHSVGSRDAVRFICPDCGHEHSKSIAYVYNNGYNCPICGDGISYPEKFMMSVLDQLNVNYKYQLSKSTFEWCDKYKYDFYLYDYNCVIETNGEQHYTNSGEFYVTVDKQKEIDKIKRDFAIANGVKYIAIDCRYSNMDWIRRSIIKELSDMFDLSNVDWLKCSSNSVGNTVKDICNYYMQNDRPSTTELSAIFKLNRTTVLSYLKRGVGLGWCDYNVKNALKESGRKKRKPISVWRDNEYIGNFDCASDFVKYAKENYNIILQENMIYQTCNDKQTNTKGFVCKYI